MVEVHYHSPIVDDAMHRPLQTSKVVYLLKFVFVHGNVNQHSLGWLEPQTIQTNKAT